MTKDHRRWWRQRHVQIEDIVQRNVCTRMIVDEGMPYVTLFGLMIMYSGGKRNSTCEEHLIFECGLRKVDEQLQ